MQGFKSFADPVSIEFNDGITCIIGPNGSGKSNISDALRWVLGEQSARQLRGGKMQEVIFAGTETRKPKGLAEVTLVINNDTGILPLEYKEVAVTRRMYRSGESEYLINGNQCRLKDIRELFMDTGIGVDGYSIIGQGKIAEIVSTKPENRRQIFEEAAGIVMYKTRKAEAENKLQSASENLDRVKDIIAEIESRIGGLKTESEKATEYIELRSKYKNLGINIILHNLELYENNIKESNDELAQIDVELTSLINSLHDFDDKLEQNRRDDARLNEELATAQDQLLAKIDELNSIANSGEINKERLSNIETELSKTLELIEANKTKLESKQNELDSLTNQDQELISAKKTINDELSQALLSLSSHTEKSELINQEINKNKDLIITKNNEIVNKNAEISTLQNYLKTLQDRLISIEDESAGRDQKGNEYQDSLNELKSKLDTKEEELNNLRETLNKSKKEIASIKEQLLANATQAQEMVLSYNKLNARKQTIEEMEHNYEGYNNAVRVLMQGTFSGIIGTVSDLIEVQDAYVTAIETALGGALQNIVCQNDASAKSAIQYLKSAKAGRATFLPLDSISYDEIQPDSGVLNHPGFLGLASDMVSADTKYDNIVKYLLCRVLVAKDMDSAISISKQRIAGFRIVTLDGELVNSQGAITGGKYKNKTANLLDRKQEILMIESELQNFTNQIKLGEQARESLIKKEQELQASIDSSQNQIQTIEVEFSVLKSDREHLLSLRDESQNSIQNFDKEKESIANDIAKANEMILKYEMEIKDNNQNIDRLSSSVEELMGEVNKYNQMIEEDNEQVVSLRVKLGEQDAKILSQNEVVEIVKDSISDINNDIENSLSYQKELEEKRNLITSTDVDSAETLSNLQAQKQNLEEQKLELSKQLDELKVQAETIQNQYKETSKKIEQLKDSKYKQELKTTKAETMIQTQKDKLWDDFEVSFAEANDLRDADFSITNGNKELSEVKLRMAELGDVNISSIEEYKQVSKRYEFMTAQEADTSKAMQELEEIISNMDKTIRTKFKENFDQVVLNFEESFKELFGGGYAELRLEDEDRPLESGIEITAQPPGKKLKNINLLSGGEKTLTAIALMFAVLKVKPTPFCILDEIEAALDEVNIERVSDYLKKFDNVQFALITHQRATMEHADVLYGVTMPEQGISKLLSLKLGDSFDEEGIV